MPIFYVRVAQAGSSNILQIEAETRVAAYVRLYKQNQGSGTEVTAAHNIFDDDERLAIARAGLPFVITSHRGTYHIESIEPI